ncbi:MAG: hypothetical protein KatS3mg032_0736 [Cyclobacteriaceae bacterium]|nr:MAG: hypothetical protein KatS3mg032_0736 [Cyclobacteriaceae bacterium]
MKYFIKSALCIISLAATVSCYNRKNNNIFNIKDFGAKDDSITLNTQAIQQAIDACSKAGGGVVLFPSGKFTTGTIILKSNIEYHFQAGSYLIGSARIEDYISPEGDNNILLIAQNQKQETLRVLLDGTGVTNVSFTGQGIIDGNGNFFRDDEYTPLERPMPWISFRQAKNITIRELTFQNSPSHVIRFEKSNQIVIDGIKIFNHPQSPNTDGIDLVDSRNVSISNSFISTGDDAICLKTNPDGITEHVVVNNCIIQSDDAAIKFGTGSAGITPLLQFQQYKYI